MKYDTEVKIVSVKQPFANTVMFHDRVKVSVIGTYAMELCKSSMHMGHEDKKTNKLRMFTPQQVVHRACAISEALFAEMDARGWIKEVPPISDIQGEDLTKVGF